MLPPIKAVIAAVRLLSRKAWATPSRRVGGSVIMGLSRFKTGWPCRRHGATRKVVLSRQITLVVRGATMVVAVSCAEAMMARAGSRAFS